MKKVFILEIVFFCLIQFVFSQEKFRSGMFLHHSTGGCIWGPNGSSTSVPEQMNLYNLAHGYTGSDAVSFDETWFPAWNDNEWATWHTIFETGNPEAVSGYLSANKMVMIKSCFPCSEIWSVGSDNDTLDPTLKSIANYKWHWRHFVSVMESHPENFFVVWTNAPLEYYSTNAAQAAYSSWFSHWAKDTLAVGLDPVYGTFPENVYVFDFFHKLADANGFLPACYAAGPGDSHPNAAATELVAPQLVTEMFDASIAYESSLTLNIRIFLEGPFTGTGMNASLNDLHVLPLSQPYNQAPWFYSGSESVTVVPDPDIVDWILLELRDASDAASATSATILERKACFILKNGTLKGIDGTSNPVMLNVPVQQLFAIVRHRNHIAVMSSAGLVNSGGVYSWDFSTGAGKAFGGVNAHSELPGGVWGMTAADGNADSQVNNGDKNDVWSPQAGTSGYRSGDFNMDGEVNNGDKNDLWRPNTGLGGQVPD